MREFSLCTSNAIVPRRAFATVCLLAGVLLGVPANATSAGDPAETVDAFHAALAAGDGDAALALLTADALVFEAGHVERDRAEYAASHLAADMAFSAGTQQAIVARTVYRDAGIAVVATERDVSGEFRGKAVNSRSLGTLVLVRADGRWLIRHIHWSSRPRSTR